MDLGPGAGHGGAAIARLLSVDTSRNRADLAHHRKAHRHGISISGVALSPGTQVIDLELTELDQLVDLDNVGTPAFLPALHHLDQIAQCVVGIARDFTAPPAAMPSTFPCRAVSKPISRRDLCLRGLEATGGGAQCRSTGLNVMASEAERQYPGRGSGSYWWSTAAMVKRISWSANWRPRQTRAPVPNGLWVRGGSLRQILGQEAVWVEFIGVGAPGI